MSLIIRRSTVDRDLVAIFRHYVREVGLRVADRFFTEAEATFARLANTPGLGTLYQPEESLYADLRYFPVSRFRKYLVFYRVIPDGVEILHILHGARDIAGILAEEFGVEGDTGDEADEKE